jgi:hypothetical protein
VRKTEVNSVRKEAVAGRQVEHREYARMMKRDTLAVGDSNKE